MICTVYYVIDPKECRFVGLGRGFFVKLRKSVGCDDECGIVVVLR
jgi:hypothetical protein